MTFREVTIQGAPYERGLQYGKACPQEIAVSIQSYTDLLALRRKITWQQAKKLALKYLPAIQACDPAYVEEMQGIADGAGVTFADILVLNARSELLHTTVPADPEDGMECTAFSAVAPATKDDVVLAGQTWDFSLAQRAAVIALRIKGEGDRPTILMFPEAGMIGGKGCNAAGLSLTLNALRTPEHNFGLPVHIRMRRILEQTYLAAAYEAAVAGEMPCAANLMMAHKDGVSIDVELDPQWVDVLLPEGGVLAHSNHFIGPKLSQMRPNAKGGGTYVRLQRARQLLCGRNYLTLADFEAACRDHKGWPSSICCHSTEVDEPLFSRNGTNFGLVMDLTHGVVRLAPGNPCESAFEEISIEG